MCVPLVCRAARLCHSAAHGGQILAPLELVQRLVKTWSGNDLELQAHHKPAKAAKPHAEQGDSIVPFTPLLMLFIQPFYQSELAKLDVAQASYDSLLACCRAHSSCAGNVLANHIRHV